MFYVQALTKREKVLALIGSALLVVFVAVGVAQGTPGSASVLLVPEAGVASHVNPVENDELRCEDVVSSFDDRRREKKNNVDRQITDIQNTSDLVDVSELTTLASRMDGAFAKADELLVGKCTDEVQNKLKDLNSDIGSYFQDFYSLSNDLSIRANTLRHAEEGREDFETNITRLCKEDLKREYENRTEKSDGKSDPDTQIAVGRVVEMYQYLCVDLYETMQQSMEAEDWDTFDVARNEFNNLSLEFVQQN